MCLVFWRERLLISAFRRAAFCRRNRFLSLATFAEALPAARAAAEGHKMARAVTRTVRAALNASQKAAYTRYSPHRPASARLLRFCMRPRGRLSGRLREVDVLGISQRARAGLEYEYIHE